MTSASVAAPIPAHVPPEAVYHLDLRDDPALLANPHERLREVLREAPPVFWTPYQGGQWIIAGYAEVFEAARDAERFSSSIMPREQLDAMVAMMPTGADRIPMATPIGMDPPEHAKFRVPLQKTFSPRAAMDQVEFIRTLCDQLIDAVIDQGHCDFIPAIAEPLPVTVFLRMMGLPPERLLEFRELVHEVLAHSTDAPGTMANMSRKVANAMLGEIMERKDNPQNDIISLLWQTEIEGQPMTLALMEDYCVLLFIAGLDTVINGMGYAVRHLAMNPDLQAKLRAQPELITEAAEEMLRRYSFALPPRRVAKEIEFAGWKMMPGDRVLLHYPAADLDPREFTAPEKFDLDREDKAHLAFGAGVHRCLGAHLARVELQVLYQQMLKRLPEFRLDPDRHPTFRTGNILAMDSLPIRWD